MTSRTRHVYSGLVVDVRVDTVVLPDGHETDLEVVAHPGGAAAVAVDAERRVCLLRQYRHAVGGWVWELPAGRLEPGESAADAARRELVEEAGVAAGTLAPLGRLISSPGVFSEIVWLFLATDLGAAPAAREPGEVIEVHWLALDAAIAMADGDEIADGKTALGLYRAGARLAGG